MTHCTPQATASLRGRDAAAAQGNAAAVAATHRQLAAIDGYFRRATRLKARLRDEARPPPPGAGAAAVSPRSPRGGDRQLSPGRGGGARRSARASGGSEQAGAELREARRELAGLRKELEALRDGPSGTVKRRLLERWLHRAGEDRLRQAAARIASTHPLDSLRASASFESIPPPVMP